MEYITSAHYREDPCEEVEAALAAGNSMDSVQATLQARLEIGWRSHDADAATRAEQQLAYLGGLGVEEAAA